MAICEVSIVPIGEGISVSKFVAGCQKVLDTTGLNYQLNPMGTVIEGELDQIYDAVKKMQQSVFDKGAKRVYSVIKIDDRRDKEHNMDYKIKSVRDKI